MSVHWTTHWSCDLDQVDEPLGASVFKTDNNDDY